MYSAPDQDLLNVVCREEILKLPAKYNAQPVHRVYHVNDYFKCYGSRAYYSEEEIEKLKDDTVIYHCFRFLGEFPWDKDNLHPDRRLLTIIWRNLHGRIISGKSRSNLSHEGGKASFQNAAPWYVSEDFPYFS